MRTRVLSRRRRGPLCRRSDVVEAWTAVAVTVLLCLTVPLAGVLTTRWTYADARAAADEQRADRHRVRAEVLERPSKAQASSGSERRNATRATVRWTDPDGVSAQPWHGSRRMSAPVNRSTSGWTPGAARCCRRSTTRRCGSTGSAWAPWRPAARRPCCCSRTAWCGGRRRGAGFEEWERDWARTGPLWTHRGV